MTENIWYVAAIWMGLAFIASLISIRVGISVALIEIVVGVIVGNIHFHGASTFCKRPTGSIFWRCWAAAF
jgi:Kef-type K+ transport system membrane component KefB